MTKALADRLAEASAEWLHLQARVAWGFGANEKLSNEELIKEKYRGIRPLALSLSLLDCCVRLVSRVLASPAFCFSPLRSAG